jgi:short-subunit dehydrogenase
VKAVVIGASAGLGRALAGCLAEAGHELVLVARDGRDLDAVSRDLSIRFGGRVSWIEADLTAFDPAALRDQVLQRLGGIDALFVISGLGDDSDRGPMADSLLRRLIEVNYTAPISVINAFLPDLARAEPTHLVGIGSVAAIRGRSRNMVYGSAKRGLEFYFEALRHRFSQTGCRVQFYRVGFMDTTMLGNQLPGPLVVKPETVARAMVRRLNGPQGCTFLPRRWMLVALILRLLPWALFKRMKA